MPTVPTNKLQEHMRAQEHARFAPGTGERHTANAVIVEVYDQEKLTTIKVDVATQATIDSSPGLLFAKVKLPDGRFIILPFKEPEDQVYLTYGNALVLEGRNAKIEFERMNIESGHIILQRSFATKQLDIQVTSVVYDVGQVV